MKKYMMKTDRQ